jgi:DNA-directed RNA polymerase subunit M/transcription elongation factor TFIIS
MEPTSTGRACPKCGSTDYLFRGRKKLTEEPGKAGAVETKYRCKECGHEWKVRQSG